MTERDAILDVPIEHQGPLSLESLRCLRLLWRAANYISLGQIFLKNNPLLEQPLEASDLKSEFFGHWGTIPGINLVYAQLNRVIKQRGVNVILIAGPGHGCPALIANTYLEGTYSEKYP